VAYGFEVRLDEAPAELQDDDARPDDLLLDERDPLIDEGLRVGVCAEEA
jgi:hypothetical protein